MNRDTTHVSPLAQPRARRLFARGLLICLLVVPLALNLPGAIQLAHAAPLEDCDADGFDDATGVAVPWPGYDETHGDTPAGPGTADWWVKQNQPATGGGGTSSGSGSGSSSGSGGSSTGGSSGSGSGSGQSGSSFGATGSKGAGSGSGGSTSTGKAASSSSSGAGAGTGAAVAAPADAQATAAAVLATATAASAATSTVASATASQASSGSAESSGVAATSGTSGASGSGTGNTNFWDALTVGFRGENQELFAGLGLLAALALAGGLALGVSELRGALGRSREQEGDPVFVEEPAVGVA